ncbi:hypothetical protein H0H87_005950, partial [Tephrocybe sp. NHM501043]
MKYVKAKLDERSPSLTNARATIPPNTAFFHGRDNSVSDLASVLVQSTRQHVCLLGPGGMGKTSTSLAVMTHVDVQARFPDECRVWVPCVKATSISLFLNTLCDSLGVSTKSGNPLRNIASQLKNSPPIVILFDNFETPWNANESEAEGILRSLHKIPCVTIFITMRGPWHLLVTSHGTMSIFNRLTPPPLLKPIPRGTLKAAPTPTCLVYFRKLMHLTAKELIDEYKQQGTLVIGQGADAQTSMDKCIGLSVYSSRMKDNPEAFQLLCILSMLPDGTTFKMLSKWWAQELPNLPGALEVLKSTVLVQENGLTFYILPVVQHFVLHPSWLLMQVQTSMIDAASAFLKKHKSKLGDPKYKDKKSLSLASSPALNNLSAGDLIDLPPTSSSPLGVFLGRLLVVVEIWGKDLKDIICVLVCKGPIKVKYEEERERSYPMQALVHNLRIDMDAVATASNMHVK